MVGQLPEELLLAAQDRALAAGTQEMQAWRRDARVLRAIAQAAVKGKGNGNAKGTREPVARAAEAVTQGDAKGQGKGKGKDKGKGRGQADMPAVKGKNGKGRRDANVTGAVWDEDQIWGGGRRVGPRVRQPRGGPG